MGVHPSGTQKDQRAQDPKTMDEKQRPGGQIPEEQGEGGANKGTQKEQRKQQPQSQPSHRSGGEKAGGGGGG
jgi:hypothetical protein